MLTTPTTALIPVTITVQTQTTELIPVTIPDITMLNRKLIMEQTRDTTVELTQIIKITQTNMEGTVNCFKIIATVILPILSY